jgi:hypothetical protein
MDEVTWATSTDPTELLLSLRAANIASERKLRLFAVACCRRVWSLLADERSRRAVEVAERYADGLVTDEELSAAWEATLVAKREATGFPEDDLAKGVFWAANATENAARVEAWRAYAAANSASVAGSYSSLEAAGPSQRAEEAIQAAILRDLFGPLPFRPVSVASAGRAWNASVVVKLAEAAYEERQMPSGALDNARLGVLADALEEAGGADPELLEHLRDGRLHVRGCHAVDLLLNKR